MGRAEELRDELREHQKSPELIERMSTVPAKILGINKGDISEGKTADLVVSVWAVQCFWARFICGFVAGPRCFVSSFEGSGACGRVSQRARRR